MKRSENPPLKFGHLFANIMKFNPKILRVCTNVATCNIFFKNTMITKNMIKELTLFTSVLRSVTYIIQILFIIVSARIIINQLVL